MPLSQDNRLGSLKSPRPDLMLRSISAFERVSAPFEYRVTAVSENPQRDVHRLLGEGFTVTLDGDNGPIRHFHGMCAQVTYGGTDRAGHIYHLVLRPEFWFLSRNRDYRIFQNMSVQEIIVKVLQDARLHAFDCELSAYPQRVYCVQYDESDFAFVSRLMEEEGIFYFFRHTESGHRLVITDKQSTCKAEPGYDEIPYHAPTELLDRRHQTLDEWLPQYNVSAVKTKLHGFYFESPQAYVKTQAGASTHPRDDAEVLSLAAAHTNNHGSNVSEADRYAKVRREMEIAQRILVTASGNTLGLIAGATFTLKNPPFEGQDGRYLVIEARHHMEMDRYTSGGESGTPGRIDIIAIPAGTNFRPHQVTPRPRIPGPQTAIVTGLAGEEIDVDKYGRVRVLFHWDTYHPDMERTSCWVRVAQFWAGKTWGAAFHPRIGHEVVVEFLEGDPDRPMVTGSVYNGANMPPYGLPGAKTKSAIKSNSSKGGGGFNEMRFEDKAGSEEIFIHAQRDMNVRVLRNLDSKIDNDETKRVGRDLTTEIIRHEKRTVKQTLTTDIQATETRTIKDTRTTTIAEGNEKYKISKGSREEEISEGNDKLAIKKGNQSVKLDQGKQDTEAMMSIEFKVGQSSIKLDQAGITIKAMQIDINAQIVLTAKGLMSTFEGTALNTVKGGLVMIN